MINFDPNGLFYWMLRTYSENKTPENKITFCNEGGSRSSKTYDAFHLLYFICQEYEGCDPLEIYVMRRTLKSCRDLTYADFKECLQKMKAYNPNNVFAENVAPVYTLFGHKIKFIGLDSSIEAKRNDILLIAEALEIENESLVDGWYMRCEMLTIADWNPSKTRHWIFDWEGRKNVYWSVTTYLNNKHCPPQFIEHIRSLNPYHWDDMHLPESKRRENKENKKERTANLYKWRVYGEGKRGAMEGLIFPDVKWIDELPEGLTKHYGLDFGFSMSPSCLVEFCIKEKKLYAKKLMYSPTKSSDILGEFMQKIGITSSDIIVADSADIGGKTNFGFVNDLQEMGFSVIKAKKPKGYILETINKINGYELHLVKDQDVQIEQENYCYMTIDGHSIGKPIDDHNHFWDALGYGLQGYRGEMSVC